VDAVARYRAASEGNDMDALAATLATEAELVSPLSGAMVFRGRDDLRILLGAVYAGVSGLTWDQEVGDERVRVVIGTCRVGPLQVGDAMVLELGDDGLIHRVRPHLRPWLATTLFAILLVPRLAGHPGVLWRALRAGHAGG
jgi:hypothetical protein